MKCWRCSRDAPHLASALHEGVLLPDGKELILKVTPEMASPPLTQRPMLCDLCWAEVARSLADDLGRRFKEV